MRETLIETEKLWLPTFKTGKRKSLKAVDLRLSDQFGVA